MTRSFMNCGLKNYCIKNKHRHSIIIMVNRKHYGIKNRNIDLNNNERDWLLIVFLSPYKKGPIVHSWKTQAGPGSGSGAFQ